MPLLIGYVTPYLANGWSMLHFRLIKTLRRWSKMRDVNKKLTVPTISRVVSFIMPPANTLCVAFFIWYFDSRLAITLLSVVVSLFAYLYSMKSHRLWHISRDPNPGLCGWFFGTVFLSLSIYFTLVLPSILCNVSFPVSFAHVWFVS